MSNPTAEVDDGLLDVCAIKKVSRLTFLSLLSSYKKGKHLDKKRARPYFNYTQTDHFRMEFFSPVAICIDGEIKGVKTVDFSIVKNGFNFVIPKGSTFKYKNQLK